MADDNRNEGVNRPEEGGLGNLPPLSDFDSGGGIESPESQLPPLAPFEFQGDTGGGGLSGLPPLSDLDVETPNPAGGAIKPEAMQGGLVSSFGTSRGGTGFQDLAADSDFSPETPDIGPGPEPSLDTPIFESAFQAPTSDLGFGTPSASLPTQTMETPVFNDAELGGGQDVFGEVLGGGQAPVGSVTPAPEFGPDTGFGGTGAFDDMAAAGAVGAAVGKPSGGPSGPSKPAKTGRGGVPAWLAMVLILIAAVVGIFASPSLSEYVPFIPNPMTKQVDQLQGQVASLQKQINELRTVKPAEGQLEVSEEKVQQLQNQIVSKTQELEQINSQLDSTSATLQERQRQVQQLEQQVAELNEEVANAQSTYEDLRNDTAIIQARQRGLAAEVERLIAYVGDLDDANRKRIATRDALQHNTARLLIHVKESSPLTPQKYDHAERLRAVEALRDQVESSQWVTPELLEAYTSLYLRELEIARSNEYFFAKIDVIGELGVKEKKWAECLMRGNWGVYYRTLDGRNVGVFENLGTVETPRWGFRENLPAETRTGIEAAVIASRVTDFENKIRLLAEREKADQKATAWQRHFDSLQ